jgi:hypothetical protein
VADQIEERSAVGEEKTWVLKFMPDHAAPRIVEKARRSEVWQLRNAEVGGAEEDADGGGRGRSMQDALLVPIRLEA